MQPKSPDLPEMQRRFRAAVLGESSAPVEPFVHAARGTAAARIAIYRHTIQGSLTDVLATAFPVVQRIVGGAFFAALARRFISAAPPAVPQLSAYGGGFAAFIAQDDVGRRLPYLADVARLEWARGETYFAADAPPLDTARLAAMSPLEMEAALLKLHPATRLVGSTYPIFRIWEVNQPAVADVPSVDMSMSQDTLVSRQGHRVVTRAIARGDAVFVVAVAAGKALGEAAAAAQNIERAFDLQTALEGHFINGSFQN